MDTTQLSPEPGWIGAFTRQQAPGAVFANNTRVKKIKSRPSDSIPDSAMGTVLGSMLDPEKGIYYFVEWDSHPKHAVTQVGWKLTKA